MTTDKDGIAIFIEFSCCTNNQALTKFLEEKKRNWWDKNTLWISKNNYNTLKQKSSLLTDQCTPPKSSSRRDDIYSRFWHILTKLPIYVKNENINPQKIFLSIHDLVAGEG